MSKPNSFMDGFRAGRENARPTEPPHSAEEVVNAEQDKKSTSKLKGLLVGIFAIALCVSLGQKLLNLKGVGSSERSAVATSAPMPAQTTNDVCSGVRFTPCFINSDGKTCSDKAFTPVGQLVGNGSYQIINREVNSSGTCVLTLNVSGTVNGTSYSQVGKVWAYKSKEN